MTQKQILPHIDQVYESMVPKLSDEQFEYLKDSMKQDGQLEPITVNDDGVILDGHNRFKICNMLGLVPKYIVKPFKDKKKEMQYVITTNLKRRQLTPFQMVELMDSQKEIFAKEAHETRKILLSKIKLGEIPKLTRDEQLKNSTDYKIGELIGISGPTVARMSYIKRHGTPQEIEQLRKGEIGTDTLFRIIVKRRHAAGEYSQHYPLVATICKKCGSRCRKRKLCHVHKKICCTGCEWGR